MSSNLPYQVPNHVLNEIRERAPLAQIIQEAGHPLRMTGRSWRGPCPFEENSGSARSQRFRVEPDHYFCNNCRESGNVFDWFMKKQGMSFPEAVATAAEIAGMDLSEYKKKRSRGTDDVKHERMEEALGALVDIGQSAALKAIANTEASASLAPLVEAGEVILLPDAGRIARRLEALGMPSQGFDDIGWTASADSLAHQWALVARRGDKPQGLRPISGRHVIGLYGESSRGWLSPASAGRRAFAPPVFIVADDSSYLALRQAGVEGIVRPLSSATLENPPDALCQTDDSPCLLVQPNAEKRRQALALALTLLPSIPRLRIAEIPVTEDMGVDAWNERRSLFLARAGTVMDWQLALAAASPDAPGMAGRLAKIIQAVDSPLEQAAYQAEAEAVLGRPIRPLTSGPGNMSHRRQKRLS